MLITRVHLEGSERLLENRITEPANSKHAGIAIPHNIKACKLIVVLSEPDPLVPVQDRIPCLRCLRLK